MSKFLMDRFGKRGSWWWWWAGFFVEIVGVVGIVGVEVEAEVEGVVFGVASVGLVAFVVAFIEFGLWT